MSEENSAPLQEAAKMKPMPNTLSVRAISIC